MRPEGTSDAALRAAIDGVGPLARRLSQAYTRLWHERVDSDLTGPQFTVLSLLHLHGAMDQRTLGELASLDKSTAAPLLDRLQRRELIRITKDDGDRRRKLITVTDAGRKLAADLAPAVIEINTRSLAGLTEAEAQRFLDLLRRVIDTHHGGTKHE
ncbi:MarR family winged helix-turn-helix transcriptional regulator [Nocardia africana]|uniref:Staphylococcal accessory regulator Z n=1 Tax=Nocardia africana TaxID=134964 RepID=A0A378WQS7_9NOCA|nr:MarR family transcriptional regulator [Nocardia africana]MCC3314932.1 MarR family transcriptional regulator [Nocardia africana]SUA42784.1 Staphylococcal accessory regulator Z [Nocardia africana]